MREALESYLRASGLEAQIRDATVFRAWSRTLGSALAARAKPVRFRDGELLVEVDSAAHLAQLKGFTGEVHRKAANRLLPRPLIHRVVFKTRR